MKVRRRLYLIRSAASDCRPFQFEGWELG